MFAKSKLDLHHNVNCVCLYVCPFVHAHSAGISGFVLGLQRFFFVVSVGVSNCDKLLGSARSFVNPGVSLRNGAAWRAAETQCSTL